MQLLKILCKNNTHNQKVLYDNLGSYMKYFRYFDESLELVKIVIEDNRKIISYLTENFFGSLKILQDTIQKYDKEKFYNIDVVIKDDNELLFHDGTEDEVIDKEKKLEEKYTEMLAKERLKKIERDIKLKTLLTNDSNCIGIETK